MQYDVELVWSAGEGHAVQKAEKLLLALSRERRYHGIVAFCTRGEYGVRGTVDAESGVEAIVVAMEDVVNAKVPLSAFDASRVGAEAAAA